MPTLEDVDVDTIKAWMDADDAVLVDVREQNEWDNARIAGATLIPMSAFDATQMPDHAGKKLVIYCHMGGRSGQVAQHLVMTGAVDEVYNMAGGIKAWIDCDHPVETD
jgi:rhodanese-related sulfurtransferase